METKYITYCRVSTKDQNISLDAQLADCKKHVEANGGLIVGSYSEKESGKNNNRPELEKAIKQAKIEGATLLVAKLDRLTRNLSFWSVIDDAKINVEAVNMPVLNALTVGIFLGLAQTERELISTRTKRALQELKANGKQLGTDNLTNEGRAKSVAVRKEKAQNRPENKQAYALVKALISSTTKAEITRRLNDGGFRTPNGKEWSKVGVANLIKLYEN